MSSAGKTMALGVLVVCGGCGGGGAATGEVEAYKLASMATEAKVMLTQLGRDARALYVEQAALPSVAAPLTPTPPCCDGPRHQCPVDRAAWSAEPWASLGFELSDPHRFRYSFQPTPTGFVATAVGDLDCDGQAVTFTLTGTIVDGAVQLAPLAEPATLD
ncbi:MAG: hypothetical protein R3B06_02370 [Kofleriaceae bacterium]